MTDYEASFLRIGNCFDQYISGAFDGSIVIGDIGNVVDAFGATEATDPVLYDRRKDLVPPEGPDGSIVIGDIGAVVAQFGVGDCSETGEFFYNGDGLRVQKWAGAAPIQTTDYAWDVGAALPVVLQEMTGGQTTYYVYGLDLISSIEGSTATHYLYDGLGSTRGLTDDEGVETDTYTYDAFGAVRSQTGSSSQPFTFTGELQDADVRNDLYYLRARHYDPGLGRFLSKDPLPYENLYSYAGNNPTGFVDPYGLCRICDWAKDRVQDVGGAIVDSFDGPYDVATIIQFADLAPVAEACFLGGAVVGSPGGIIGMGLTGLAAYGFCDTFVEPFIGVAAGYATFYQIQRSGCSSQRKAAAHALNLVSVGVDNPLKFPLLDEVADLTLFVAGNELIDCVEPMRGEK